MAGVTVTREPPNSALDLTVIIAARSVLWPLRLLSMAAAQRHVGQAMPGDLPGVFHSAHGRPEIRGAMFDNSWNGSAGDCGIAPR